ncbi:non-homologous end-joining DNA ligase [Streptomyces sp. OfavH-34-F]|uniref:non-homologous end-joining DNA ligase n=1 Tax=Streptomyces sp. OfavH-34-F TaxID=2917760 RepID=UPI001EF3B276|nr:non-homologous end-joining DNA ligase [Streptomyces sp. OfavH-34-F]MCG7525597.1 non-homologous end-joining DNA ligase [Streptomyces sp. OfavH-34-F]
MALTPADASGALPSIAPMLAVPGPLPVPDTGWAFEAKWDGARCVVSTPGDGTLRLTSRARNDVTPTYPELHALAEVLRGRRAVLDGEIVALDASGRSDFGLLQRRMGVMNARRAARLALDQPAHLVVFDVMYLDGRTLTALGYEERRAVLAGLLPAGPHWSVPSYVRGSGAKAWETVVRGGLEGVVAKRLTSPYLPGVRSPDWRKTKRVETLDVVIGGWTQRGNAPAGVPGAVLVGVDAPAGLRYAGAVGSGMSDRELSELREYLRVIARPSSPFAGPVDVAGAHWVEPRLVAEVSASQWTAAGRLRHPVWQRLRPDLTRLD